VIAQEGEALAEFRLQAVRRRVANGESAPIDTIEALLELQRREVTRFEAEASFYLSSLDVTAYLWDDAGRPAPLPADAKPVLVGIGHVGIDSARLEALLDLATRRNPDLLKVQARIKQAEAQRLFSTQALLPLAEAKLAGLGSNDSEQSFFDGERLDNNYKAGLSIKSPLLFLRETGRFASAGQRLEFQRLERDRLRRDDLRGKPSQRPPPPKGSPRFQRRVLEPPCREPIPRPLARAAQFRGTREPRPHDVGEMAQRRHHFGTIEAFVANAGDGVGAKRDGGRDGGRGSQFLLGPLLRGRRLRVSHAGDRKPKQHNRPAGNGGLHFPSLSGAATRRNRKKGDAETARANRKTAQPAWSG
jgi:hypothetical protein